MRKTFKTQPELFVARAELDHPSLHGLDGAEAAQSGPGNRKSKSTAQGKSGKATKFLMLWLAGSCPHGIAAPEVRKYPKKSQKNTPGGI